MFNGPVFNNETIQSNARAVNAGGISESLDEANALYSRLTGASFELVPSSFGRGVLYSGAPGVNGDLTWTRGGDAFRTNASGVIQRVPWNLLQRSEEFDNAIWIKSSVTVTSNQATSPDGNLTADLLTPTGSDCVIRQSITPSSVSAYTFSVWLRSATGSDISTTIRVWRDSPFQNITNTAITVTSTWQRFTLNFTPIDLTSHAVVIGGSSTLSSGENLFAYGAQLVEGTTAQTYLPTTDRLNFPRLDYTYGSCPSALLEPQRTNLITQSQNFTDVSWSKLGLGAGSAPVVTANAGISPEGINNATRVQFNCGGTTSSDRSILQKASVSITNTTNYAATIYVKAYSSGEVGKQLRFISESAVNQITITLTDSWQRVSTTGVSNAILSNYLIETRGTFTTNTTADILIYGAQLEAGAYPTTYIPTTSATATRVADSFSRSNIYTNGLISASGGTWFVELRGNVAYTRDNSSAGIFVSDDINNTVGNSFFIAASPSDRLRISKRVSGVGTQIFLTTTNTVKIAIKWNGSTADVFANGTKVVSATSFTATNMEYLNAINSDTPKFIQQMALFPTPLSDTDCASLTADYTDGTSIVGDYERYVSQKSGAVENLNGVTNLIQNLK